MRTRQVVIELPRDVGDTTRKWARLDVLAEIIPHAWQSSPDDATQVDLRITVRGNGVDAIAAFVCRIPSP